jgi:hypothetical protein
MTRNENPTKQDYAPTPGETNTGKEYHRPELRVYGSIATLTAGSVNPETGMDNPGNQKTG